MNSTPIDPATINTWEDAFQHPIPAVRTLERQLRADLQTNKEKLRGLVGESYRDLLQTAHRIIDMDAAAAQLEQHLSETSRNCNSRLLDRKAKNLRGFYESAGKKDREKFGLAARLAVLQACPTVLARLLHRDRGEGCLVSAQVFVISRLLLKSFSDQPSIPLVESLRDQLGLLRPTLLRHIDSLLSSGDLVLPTLVSTMTAYSVLKSASPVDVLRQFLSIRATSISGIVSLNNPPTTDSIISSVSLLNKTLAEADSIFPRQLQKALIAVKGQSFLQNPAVEALPELGLDVNARWLPDDVKGFIPWIRHDDLEGGKVAEMVKSWAEKEVAKLKENLLAAVAGVTDIDDLVKLRHALLQEWRVGVKSRRKFFDIGNEGFRGIIMERFNAIVKEQIEGLDKVADVVEMLLPEAEKETKGTTSLWSSSLLQMDLSAGALSFRDTVSARAHGKSGTVRSFIASYSSFTNIIATSSTTIRTLRTSTSLSRPNAGDDAEDDFEVEEQIAEDGAADSTSASSALSIALETAYKDFEARLKKMAEDAGPVRRKTFLVRVIRHVRTNAPSRDGEVLLPLVWFGTGVVPKLQSSIAAEVAKGPLEMMEEEVGKNRWDQPVTTKSLWEGEPPLPTLPSRLVFRFLRQLVAEMSAMGDDIWTAAAVKSIKAHSCDNIWRIMGPSLQNLTLYDPDALVPEPVTEAEETSGTVKENEPSEDDNTKQKENEETMETETTEMPPSPTPATKTLEPSSASPSKSPRKPASPPPIGTPNSASPTPTPVPTSTTPITSDQIHQLLFDSLYLDEVLHRRRRRGQPNGIGSVVSLAAKVDSVVGKALHVEEELRVRLEGAAREYWKKTGLLFGLLGS